MSENWIIKMVAAHDAAHAERQRHFQTRRAVNETATGNEFPYAAPFGSDTYRAFSTYRHTMQAPIIPARISAKHPMAH